MITEFFLTLLILLLFFSNSETEWHATNPESVAAPTDRTIPDTVESSVLSVETEPPPVSTELAASTTSTEDAPVEQIPASNPVAPTDRTIRDVVESGVLSVETESISHPDESLSESTTFANTVVNLAELDFQQFIVPYDCFVELFPTGYPLMLMAMCRYLFHLAC